MEIKKHGTSLFNMVYPLVKLKMIDGANSFIRFILSIEFTKAWLEENRIILIHAAGILLILFAAVYIIPLSIIGNQTLPRFILIGVLGIIGGLIIIAKPSLTLIGIIPAAMIVPLAIGTGTGTEINAAILLEVVAIGLWFLEAAALRKPLRINSAPVILALALAGSAALSFIVGQINWFYTSRASVFAQVGGVMLYLFAVGAFLLVAYRIKERGLIWMSGIFICLGSFYIILRFLITYLGYAVNPFFNIFQSGSFGSLFWVWILCMLLGQSLFNNKLHQWIRGVLLILTGLTIYIAFFQARGWTSGWLPPLAGAAVILWVGLPKYRIPFIIVVLVALVLKGESVYNSFVGTIFTGDNEYSTLTRIEAWKILYQIFKVNPIFGVGPANYYFYTSLYPILNYSVQFNSHSNYVDLLIQTGVLGFAFFVLFIFQLTRLGLKLIGRVNEGFRRAYLLSAIGGTIGTAIAGIFGDWVIPFVYNVGFDGFRASIIGWLFMGGIVAIEHFLEDGEGSSGNVPPGFWGL